MRIRSSALVIMLSTGAVALSGAAAHAAPKGSFGEHVRDCAVGMPFSGSHNPGMHSGAAGWDGLACE